VHAPEDRSKALNEHMSSGFAPRADIVLRAGTSASYPIPVVSRCSKMPVHNSYLLNHLVGNRKQS
jgi:hypothetical protein